MCSSGQVGQLQEIVRDSEACCATVHGAHGHRAGHDLAPERQVSLVCIWLTASWLHNQCTLTVTFLYINQHKKQKIKTFILSDYKIRYFKQPHYIPNNNLTLNYWNSKLNGTVSVVQTSPELLFVGFSNEAQELIGQCLCLRGRKEKSSVWCGYSKLQVP